MSATELSDAGPARLAAILAGGASRRMGAPKAAANLDGRPLVTYAIEAALAAGLQPLVVARADSELPELDCAVLIEPGGVLHPAAGIVAALAHAGEPIVVLPCDAPFIPPELIADLAKRTGPFAMPSHPRPQPLVARYTPALLPRLRAAVAEGEPMNALAEALGGERLGAEEVRQFGDSEWIFVNANDPDEVERLGAELRRRRREQV